MKVYLGEFARLSVHQPAAKQEWEQRNEANAFDGAVDSVRGGGERG
jgi:hypothetical protein